MSEQAVDEVALGVWLEGNVEGFLGPYELSKFPSAVKVVQQDVSRLTAELADYERIRRVALLPNEFSIDGGELTPTLKVKRKVIDERYGDLIEELYS